MPSSLLQRISDRAATLSRSERRVADYVLEHHTEIVNLTLAALAEAVGVSEPTVVRFCNSMGFSGFQEFRFEVTRFLAIGVPVTHSAIEADDSAEVIVTKVFDHTISGLDYTRRSFNPQAILEAVELIRGAHRLHFFGVGASSIIAQDAQQKAPWFGRPCTAEADPHKQFMEAATANEDDLFFIISYTGKSFPLPQIAKEARRSGAKVVAITGEGASALAKESDLVLVTETLENTDLFAPSISRIAGLVVIDILSTITAQSDGFTDREKLMSMKLRLADFKVAMNPEASA